MSKPTITICMGSSCFARGNERNLAVCEAYLEAHGLKDEVDVDLQGSLCTGNCAEGPVVIVDGRIYRRVDGGAMGDILRQTFEKNRS